MQLVKITGDNKMNNKIFHWTLTVALLQINIFTLFGLGSEE
jgi:hypothetical protein